MSKSAKVEVKVQTLDHFDPQWGLPGYETEDSAGADIRASLPEKRQFEIPAGERVLIPTGLKFEIPRGYEIQVRPRSGLSLKTGLLVVNSPGTIDADFRGEVKVIMGNLGKETEVIQHGDRVAQLVLAPVTRADFFRAEDLSQTRRGDGGFGSTGKN